MSSRRRRVALHAHVEQFQRVISVILHGSVTSRGSGTPSPSLDELSVVLNSGDRVRIRGDVPLDVMAVQQVRLVDDSLAAEITGDIYAIWLHDGPEIVAYHWHPQDPNGVKFPHVHAAPAVVQPGGAIRPRDLHKVHFPTGVVSLASVIRPAITEFGVDPLRPDWDAVLADADAPSASGA